MKDPYAVLHQKEQDVARVRKEIRALLIIIPLLSDAPATWADLKAQLLNSCRSIPDCIDKGMAELERYYPFTRNS